LERPWGTVAPFIEDKGSDTSSTIAEVAHHAKVLTVSESVHAGTRDDRSGDALVATLTAQAFQVVDRLTVPDGVAPVSDALLALVSGFNGLIVTTGGTGFSPSDLTPEATRNVLEREAPGLAEAMRSSSPLGALSRGIAGTVGSCLVVNVPGSPRGAVESIEAILDLLPHALELLAGAHPH
jgi:molybdopterin adenylyltransferase